MISVLVGRGGGGDEVGAYLINISHKWSVFKNAARIQGKLFC